MPRRVLEGKVVSDKMDKTVTVLVERRVKDPLYHKVVRKSAKYAAHDEANSAKTGDWVAIEECKPISKRKTWKLVSGGAAAAPVKEEKAKKAEPKKEEAKKPAAKKAAPKKEAAKKPAAKKAPAKKAAPKKKEEGKK